MAPAYAWRARSHASAERATPEVDFFEIVPNEWIRMGDPNAW
jgi:hypothetical protein